MALVCGLLLAWAAAASWLAYDRSEAALRHQAEQAAQRSTYEDKVRALTRRLVGVASHQSLEQDGLAGRLSDIITRQVEIENRLATLSTYAERLAEAPGASPSAAPSPGAQSPGTSGSGAHAFAAAEPATPRPSAEPAREAGSEPGVLRLGVPAR